MEVVVPDEFKYLYVVSKERPVLKVPNGVLRQKAQVVSKIGKKHQELIDEMVRIMRKAHGVGLAAPQVGVLQRIIVIAPVDMKPMALINPAVAKAEGEQVGVEGCLSIPGLYGEVKRAQSVAIDAVDRRGRGIRLEMEGMPARVVLHEIDHLDGILFTDKVDLATLHWAHPEGEPNAAE